MTESEQRAASVIAEGVSKGIKAGVTQAIKLAVIWIAAALFAISALSWCQPTDSTDYSRADRSGLKLHTDAMTGCQYLSTSGGGITPRLNNQGHYVCQQPTTPETAKDKK